MTIESLAESFREAKAKARRSQNEQARVEWVEGNMLDFSRPDYYDAVINLYTSFGYFKDPKDDLRVLHNFFAALKPGGKLLMDTMSRDLFQKSTPPFTEKQQADGSIIRAEFRFQEHDQSWLESKWSYESSRKHACRSRLAALF